MMEKIKLYKCNAMIIDESKSMLFDSTSFNTIANIVTEYIFAYSKTEATNIFENRYENNVHLTVSEVKFLPATISTFLPGLIIYKNKYNSTIEDNELTLNVERSDNK